MNDRTLSSLLLNEALALGADAAGIANIQRLQEAPAFRMMPLRPHMDRVGGVPSETGLPEGVVAWPEGMASVLVIACHHPEDQPHMDHWIDHKCPPGNLKMIRIFKALVERLGEIAPEVQAQPMNYYVEKGGVWLKDAAVEAGLGVIGKNNLLVTPRFGPRVRLRAMYLSADLPSTGPLAWDPCDGCAVPCRAACPQAAFAETIYDPADYEGLTALPGRTGCYSLRSCDRQMADDEAHEQVGPADVPGYGPCNSVLAYCRRCELSCPVGKPTGR